MLSIRRVLMRILCLFALGCSPVVLAAPLLDCPLRDRPHSVDGPLIDLLLSAPAKALIETHKPGFLKTVPSWLSGTSAPTFSAIMTLRKISGFLGSSAEDLGSLEKALAVLPVTRADKAARCARYDNEQPALDLPSSGVKLLLFEKMTGFRDTPSVEAANAAFRALAARKGWTLVVTDKGGAMTPAVLRRFDAIIWNNVSGDVLTLSQRKAFENYISRGGGFVGVHGSAGDPVYFWDWYADKLIGARFIGHPMTPQFQDARVQIENSKNGIGKDLSPGWTMQDEWYSFAKSPRLTGASIVATLDEASYSPIGMGGQNLRMADHPIAWTRCVGKGRAFYSAIGHRPESYAEPHFVALLEQGIAWAAEPHRTVDRC
jgi:uncharacterized protein